MISLGVIRIRHGGSEESIDAVRRQSSKWVMDLSQSQLTFLIMFRVSSEQADGWKVQGPLSMEKSDREANKHLMLWVWLCAKTQHSMLDTLRLFLQKRYSATHPHSIRTAHLNHPFNALPHLCTHHRLTSGWSLTPRWALQPRRIVVVDFLPHQTGFHHKSPNVTPLGRSANGTSFGLPYLTSCCCQRWKRHPMAAFITMHSI